jgi:hypothetical protein
MSKKPRHCWLRLQRHRWELTKDEGPIDDGYGYYWYMEWRRCTRCGHLNERAEPRPERGSLSVRRLS